MLDNTEPNITDLNFPATDGYSLGATLFEPQERNGRAVLVNPAMAVKRGYYHKYAAYLAGRGFTVLTYDYRGVGDSAPKKLRGFEARLADWGVKDTHAAIEWLLNRYPAHKLLVVAHSVGGQILGLTPLNSRIEGVFMVACQSGYWGNWPGLYKLGVLAIWCLIVPIPAKLLGYLPGKVMLMSEDLPAGVVLEWARGGRHPDYILSLYRNTSCDHFATLTAPVMSYSFGDDHYAPEATVKALLPFYPNAQKTHNNVQPKDIGVDNIGHFGFFRAKFEGTLWQQSAEWLEGV
jgi:predicted alpha/beta hydrolase